MDPLSHQITGAMDAVRPYVVHVAALDRKQNSMTLGTGLVLDNYHVLTSGQIAGVGDEVTVRTADGRKFGASCLAVDPLYFLSVLRLDGRWPGDPPPLTPDAEIRPGRACLAIGFALGVEQTASLGIVSARDHTLYRPERYPVDGLIITDAAIHPGNTGGPLIDLEGRFMGINGVPWIQGLNLALRFEQAARVANQIIEYGRATHPWLGFSGQPEVIDPTLVSLLGLPVDRGVVVQHVHPEGPARRAGIEVMDMVVRVAGRPALHVGQLRQVLAVHRPGQTVPVTVLRGGDLVDLDFPVENIPGLFKD